MFTFFHRTPKLVLDCFTTNQIAYNLAPIVKTQKTLPKWWKDLPPSTIGTAFENPNSKNNMRRCYGFVELYKKGVILQHWADINVNVSKEKYDYWISIGNSPDTHQRNQYAGVFMDYHHMKLSSPWFIREKTGTKFIFVGAEWALEDYQFRVLPGVLEFQVNTSTNVNLMWPIREKPYDTYIPIGQPLVQIVPLADVELEVKCHLVSSTELEKIIIRPGSFKGHKEMLRLWKKAHTDDEPKCPFAKVVDKFSKKS